MIWTWILIGAGILAGLVLIAWLAGLCLPRSHVLSRSLKSGQPPEAVWQAVTDYAAAPTWNPMVQRVERLPDRDGCETWRETYKGCPPMTLITQVAEPPRRLVRSIRDAGSFSGRWEFEIAPEADGSRVTITEHGEIPNPLIRLMARLFMDPAMYLEQYLKALAGKFGEPAVIDKGVGQPRSTLIPSTPKGA